MASSGDTLALRFYLMPPVEEPVDFTLGLPMRRDGVRPGGPIRIDNRFGLTLTYRRS
jgi:hypothetical protein